MTLSSYLHIRDLFVLSSVSSPFVSSLLKQSYIHPSVSWSKLNMRKSHPCSPGTCSLAEMRIPDSTDVLASFLLYLLHTTMQYHPRSSRSVCYPLLSGGRPQGQLDKLLPTHHKPIGTCLTARKNTHGLRIDLTLRCSRFSLRP